MRKILATSVAFAALGATANAAQIPYEPLAQALGVPQLLSSIGTKDKSQLQLEFTKDGQTSDSWTKRVSISIAKVPADDTALSTFSIIESFRHELDQRHAHVDVFDTSPLKPYTSYFEYHIGTEREKGVVYSPDPGYVTIAQVAEKIDDTISEGDVKILKQLIGRQ